MQCGRTLVRPLDDAVLLVAELLAVATRASPRRRGRGAP